MSNKVIELGDRVRDPVTGFSGIAVCITTYLHGCIRIGVQPEKPVDGRIVDPQYLDQVQLELVKKTVHVSQVLTVGPKPAPETRRSNGGPAREGAGFRRR